ncbi:MAG: hypothetical protein AAGJ82_04035 [Bacteroidota bacterium]
MRIHIVIHGLLLLLMGGMTSCDTLSGEAVAADRLLAKVGSKSLYISQMEGMFVPGLSSSDSAQIIQTYVGRWLRETAILAEAEKNVPADFNINEMVRDYRASLLTSNYEKVLVEQRLDSIITLEELERFYVENQLLYELQKPIVRCYFIKVPTPTPEGNRLRELWNQVEEDPAALQAYCEQYAEVALLKDSLWYAVEDVAQQLPEGTLTVANIGDKREFTQRDAQHQYYFRLFELKKRTEIAPLSYVEDQARKVILHKRKLQLVEQLKEEIYQRELDNGEVEIFY